MTGEQGDQGKRRSKLGDVAALAGVGIATVDRVLNERGGVSPETARRVVQAARKLGLKRTLPVSHQKGLRFEVLLTRPELPLIERMSRTFADLAETLDHSIVIQRSILEDDRPARLAERLRSTEANAVILYAQEDPTIHDAIADRARTGVPVVTLISDVPAAPRLAYAGIDQYAAGRTAGYYVARLATPGPVVVVCNHHSYRSHAERVEGFRAALDQHAKGVVIAEIIEGGDQALRSERLLTAAVQRHPGVVALYDAGAAHKAIEAVLRSMPRPVVFVGHELTPHTKAMMQSGLMSLIIDQNPERQARYAIDVLLHRFGRETVGAIANRPTGNTPFTLHGPYNLDP